MELTFLGATETVTGSKYLLSFGSKKILIDCGLFQGRKELRLRNWNPLPLKASTIDAVLLTHAHIDHTGYLPLFVKNGFTGKIYCTEGTRDLCSILLPDSGYLQEEEARYANQHGYSKHHPAKPLYTITDAQAALKQFKPLPYNQTTSLFNTLDFKLIRCGHIIGASQIQLKYKQTTVVFTGDLGRPHDPVMQPPEFINEADYLVIESTYGDRLHSADHPKKGMKEAINKTIRRGGTVVIPAFAVGRTQNMLYYIALLKQEKAIPDVPVYLDSPMAINCTELLCKHIHDLRLTPADCKIIANTAIYVNTVEQSKQLDLDKTPKIIISASGMLDGGRVLHHVKTYARDKNSTLLFTGYQSPETRGEKILSGATEIKMLGEVVPIRAEVTALSNISAHADYAEILAWLSHFKKAPKKVFLTHGEHQAALALKAKIEKQFSWTCVVPQYQQVEKL